MAIITQGTTIKKVMSGGTPIKKVMSGGTVIWTSTVMRTITIPVITGVATQTLKIGANQIYSGAGGAGVTVQVEHGSSVIISATAATGYENPIITTPVTANTDFSTATYITAGRRIWTFSEDMNATKGYVKTVTISGLKINTLTNIEWAMSSNLDSDSGDGTISSTTDSIGAISGGIGNSAASVKISIVNANELRLEVTAVGTFVNYIGIEGTIYQ